MMQVVLVVRLEHGCIIFPAGLPGYEKPQMADENGDSVIGHCLTLDLPELQVYLRLHDFLMGNHSPGFGVQKAYPTLQTSLSMLARYLLAFWSSARRWSRTL